MSDEKRTGETEVEGHGRKVGANEEPANAEGETEENEVEAHVQRVGNVRMDSPSND